MWLTGDADQGPVPMGLAVADILAGATAAQGILAALVRRGITGAGAHVETSLLEVLVDLQFEVLTTHLNDGGRPPRRAAENGAHAYLSAPYGVYQAADGWLAIAMTPLSRLAILLDLPALDAWPDPASWFSDRDRIKAVIAARIGHKPVAEWLARLEPADIWCAKVLDWPELLASEAFRNLDMLQTVSRAGAPPVRTTRAPLRIDGQRPECRLAAPKVGAETRAISAEFGLGLEI
jgi:CoA:oxalate CoA-transferase